MVKRVSEIQALVDEEMVKADLKSRNRLAVIGDHAKAEGNREKKARKLVETKYRSHAASRRGERAFDAEPHDQNDREGPEHIVSHDLKKRGVLGHEIGQKGKE